MIADDMENVELSEIDNDVVNISAAAHMYYSKPEARIEEHQLRMRTIAIDRRNAVQLKGYQLPAEELHLKKEATQDDNCGDLLWEPRRLFLTLILELYPRGGT